MCGPSYSYDIVSRQAEHEKRLQLLDEALSEQHARLARIISELMKARFYGNLEIKFQSGQISIINKMESMKV